MDAGISTDRARHWLAAATVLAIASVYTYCHLKTGWLPGDDGTLAQSALRVLHGQLPHRDFVENYTGGLSFYHALAFRLFGVNLVAMRYAAFAVFVPWVAAIYYIASRIAKPLPAAAITLLCAVWSLPTYPTPMPSWYNLFLAGLGAAAVVRFLEARTRRWLVLAGVCGGLSCLVKIIGLYYVAAVLLFFLFREQDGADEVSADGSRGNGLLYRLFASVGLLLFLGSVLRLIRNRITQGDILHFLLPSAVLVALLVRREWQVGPRRSTARFRKLFSLLITFCLGLAVPIACFLIPYWRSASLRSLYHGVFTAGAATAASVATSAPVGFIGLGIEAPLIAAIWIVLVRRVPLKPLAYALAIAATGAMPIGSRLSLETGLMLWTSATMLTPLVVVFGALVLAYHPRFAGPISNRHQQQIFLFIALAGVCSLVQFPFAVPIYFCYFAPLTALAALAVLSIRKRHACEPILGCLLGLYLLFAVVWIVPNTVYQFNNFEPLPPAEAFKLPRGEGLSVISPATYRALTLELNRLPNNGIVVAAPECPEVYFLSGLRNPTRNDGAFDPEGVLRAIEDGNLKVIVVNRMPHFPSAAPPRWLLDEIGRRFPDAVAIGKYEVRRRL